MMEGDADVPRLFRFSNLPLDPLPVVDDAGAVATCFDLLQCIFHELSLGIQNRPPRTLEHERSVEPLRGEHLEREYCRSLSG